jgi:hypothetical protein
MAPLFPRSGPAPGGRERLLDRALALAEPIECAIEFILVHLPEADNVAEAGGGALGIEHAGGGELSLGDHLVVEVDGKSSILRIHRDRYLAREPKSDVVGARDGIDFVVRQCRDNARSGAVPILRSMMLLL